MSTLKVNTLSNLSSSKSVPTDTVVDGSAKAWVNFNGTGVVAIRAAFNVSSITDNGAGDYTANFLAALADANYAGGGMSQGIVIDDGGGGGVAKTPSAWRFSTINTGAARTDYANVLIQVFR